MKKVIIVTVVFIFLILSVFILGPFTISFSPYSTGSYPPFPRSYAAGEVEYIKKQTCLGYDKRVRENVEGPDIFCIGILYHYTQKIVR